MVRERCLLDEYWVEVGVWINPRSIIRAGGGRVLKPALQLHGIKFDATDRYIRYGMAWHPRDIELMHLTLPCIDASRTL